MQVGDLVAALRRRPGPAQGALADAAEAQPVTAAAVHDDRVVVRELTQRAQPVRLALAHGRVEVDAVALVVLCAAELGIARRPAPVVGITGVQALVRVGTVDPAQRRQIAGEHVAGAAVAVQLHQAEHVAGAGAEADDARGVAAAVADVLDVLVLRLPVERGVLRARHELHGDLLLRRVVEPRRAHGRGRGPRGGEQGDGRQGRTCHGEHGTARGARVGSGVAEGVPHGISSRWWGVGSAGH